MSDRFVADGATRNREGVSRTWWQRMLDAVISWPYDLRRLWLRRDDS